MKIVIVGGGSAGWMSAITLQLLENENVEIHVIESPLIPPIGVGESTIKEFIEWMLIVGLNPHEVLKECNGTYKLAIKFIDFNEKGKSFYFPFGKTFANKNMFEIWNCQRLFSCEKLSFADSFYPNMALIHESKFATDKDDFSFNNFALHFDAALFAEYLKARCIRSGVHFHSATVDNIMTNADGIEAVVLDSGEIIVADLFIDCTGFKSLLLEGALKEPFIDYSNIIPNNKAYATKLNYINKEQELNAFTSCTALQNGWVWNIPLWSRIGSGYVYSNRFISDDEALNEFKSHLESIGHSTESLEFRNINIKNGVHERLWVKNVVAIGLSAGFVEPLESTGLWFIHTYILLLLKTLKKTLNPGQIDRDIFNKLSFKLYDNLASFVSIHYGLSKRRDSQYWVDVSKRSYLKDNNTMNGIMYSFQGSNDKLNSGLQCIASGFEHFIFNEFDFGILNNHKNDIDILLRNPMKWKKDAETASKVFTLLNEIHEK